MLTKLSRAEKEDLADEMRELYVQVRRDALSLRLSMSEAQLSERLRRCAHWILDSIGEPAELPLLADGESPIDLYTLAPAVMEESHAPAGS